MRASIFLAIALVTSLTPTTTSSDDVESPFWGRIYLRHAVAPIQYFRDSYGGDIPSDECKFVTPSNNMGCTEFNEDDLALISNKTCVILDRGVCSFEVKSRNVQAAGAAGLVLVSNSEEVVRPVAHVDDGDIEIPTVMVRKSGGDLIRVAANREDVFGRLIPMACPKSVCGPYVPDDLKYMTSVVRGGLIHSDEKTDSEWEFLASMFGSPFLTRALTVVDAMPADGCSPLTSDVTNRMVLIHGNETDCTFLTKVSNAQVAGAASVLFVQKSNLSLKRPSIPDQWAAYNITIPSGMISSKTAYELLHHTLPVVLKGQSQVADAWETIDRLADLTEWPTRKNRRDAFLLDMLKEHGQSQARRQAIRGHFTKVVGGSKNAWDHIEAQFHANVHDEL
ncbi:Aste57867_22218 [Aphanomyces stellatus]|uniref:Aste57867_22218 protein n=1 Tax=Aphanomyces stellatus TaxID=120398 RepID=A0A485LL08_9STRA|nr:hypothetical protein As57867_022149 [Aphanomyces stellatus]VFT98885.1 Aste57867_22218 [Aphanomyces stellatus]